MDEASLVIKFRDESPAGASGTVAGFQPSVSAQSDYVQTSQQAITQAGGVGNYIQRNQVWQTVAAVPAVSIPPATVTETQPIPEVGAGSQSNDALLKLALNRLIQQGGETDVEKAIAFEQMQNRGGVAEKLTTTLQAVRLPSEPLPPIKFGTLIDDREERDQASIKAASDEYNEALRKIQREERESEMAARKRFQDDLDEVLNKAKYDLPKPPPLTKEQIIAESERQAPPVQGELKEEKPDVTALHNTLAKINSLAGSLGGPTGQAISSITNPMLSSLAELGGAAGLAGAAEVALPVLGVAAAGAAAVAAGGYFQSQRLQETAQYSPEVALSIAESHISRIQRAMRTAETYGEQIAASQRLTTKVKDEYLDIGNSIKQGLVDLQNVFNVGAIAIKDGLQKAGEELIKLNEARERDEKRLKGGRIDFNPTTGMIRSGFLNIIPTLPEVDLDAVLKQQSPVQEKVEELGAVTSGNLWDWLMWGGWNTAGI